MKLPEASLVSNIKKNRDMVAFQSLVLAHQERISFLIRRCIGIHEDAQDLRFLD